MIGKGLESLLPKKASDGKSPSKDAVVSPPRGETPLGSQPRSVIPDDHRARSVSETLSHATSRPPRKVYDESIFHIEVDKIKPNPYQPRRAFKEEELEELTVSIREFGILQPIVVMKRVEETAEGAAVEYELLVGERRLLAAKRAGLPRVPAVVRTVDSRLMKLEVALVENIQRSDLTPLETARAYARLQEEFGLTQREVGVRVGKSREVVANTLRLLHLPTEALTALSLGEMSESQARGLLSKKAPPPRPQSPEDVATVRALEERLGAPVKVVRKNKGGTIVITFYSDEEYHGVRARLLGEEW
ncbi:MAG: ParB/RepB/Spo0J family partition protein [Candidatus Jorgensenbacteria bacterium]|nr:ParB/RepB/Spo0J family partition protein [Candidatus Jorgensenbacteria bacterium]